MLIALLKNVLNNEEIFNKIYSSFYNPTLTKEESKKSFKLLIQSLINYFNSDFNEKIFHDVAKDIFKDIEIKNINFENIIRGFNVFIFEFLQNNIHNLTIQQIKNFTYSVNLLLTNISLIYNKKLSTFNERILNNISSGIIILDNNLNIIKTNKKFYEILGYNYSFNLLGRNLKDILIDREGIPIEKLKEICVSQNKLSETELFVIRKDGKKVHRTIYADILYDENKEQQGFIVYVKDTDYLQYLKETFSKYLSQQVAEKILSEKDINLKGERKNVAVMFIDIRDFTKFSENNSPEYVLKILNEYFSFIIDIIFEFGGTLDKFIGDGVMVLFGAPIDYSDSVERCLKCAKKIQNKVKKFNENKKINFNIGIGINYGEVIVGNIGSENKRIDYTAIGDTVNTAQRVEKITPGGKIYITNDVVNSVHNIDNYSIKFVGIHKFKGKTKPVKIYEVI